MKYTIILLALLSLLAAGCIFDSKKDKTPGPESPIAVLDSDKDGVVDDADKCPTEAGTVANNGCPTDKKDNEKDTPTKMRRGPGVKLPPIDTIAVR